MKICKTISWTHSNKPYLNVDMNRKSHLWCYLLLLFLFAWCNPVSGQHLFITQESIVQELQKRGLNEEEVRQELLLKGLDLSNLDPTQLSQDQIKLIERTILDLEEAKANQELNKKNVSATDLLTSKPHTLINNVPAEQPPVIEQADYEISSIYGQELFRNKLIDVYRSSSEINAPDNYVLGPGDELVVSIWGVSQFENNFVIAKDGFIKVADGRQRVYLRGMRLSDARNKLKSILSRIHSFREGEFDMSLSYSRTVRISIYGEVFENPGSYTLPAFNSAFNALAIVKGTSDIGSLRKIQVQKASGELLTMDVYALLTDPSIHNNYFLEENDVILIPVSENLVTIEGEVKRPLKYELLKSEGLVELLTFCGGFTEYAYKKKIQIKRVIEGNLELIDVDWDSIQNGNFILQNGDAVKVESLDVELKIFVEVQGEVENDGIFERRPGMKLNDLLLKAILKETSSTEQIFVTRTNTDGTREIIILNLGEALQNNNSTQNIVLRDKDIIEIWSKERFNDSQHISVSGSVRLPGSFPHDNSKSIRVRDAILRAGGMTRDASNIAVIHKNDPLNPKTKYYKTIDQLDQIFDDPNNPDNVLLNPFDSLVIESKNTFLEESYVRIEGAVNKPGKYQFGIGMNIKDIMALSGGFKLAASTNNIEISRVIIVNNQPTKTIVDKLELDRNFNVVNSSIIDYRLEPFDNIAVRFINEFELQQRVFLSGEVRFPGPYAISKNNERISSVIQRAGGLAGEAFPAGATLERSEGDYGSIVIKLEEILNNPNSEFNFIVKNGDIIDVPKIKEFVTIRGATKVKEVVGEGAINEGNEIHVPFHLGKDALFYINE